MKKAMLGMICIMLAGCDYTVPLVKTPEIEIDQSLVGVWEMPKTDSDVQRLLILPLNKVEYMVSFPAGSKDAMFARGSLWQHETMQLFQLDWFGSAQGALPANHRTFQFASYAVEENQLSVRLLNPEVVPREIATTETLVNAVTVNRAKPDLFKKAIMFSKVQK